MEVERGRPKKTHAVINNAAECPSAPPASANPQYMRQGEFFFDVITKIGTLDIYPDFRRDIVEGSEGTCGTLDFDFVPLVEPHDGLYDTRANEVSLI